MTTVNEDFPDHIIALLGYVMDGFRRDLTDRMRQVPQVRGLRSSHLRLLSLTPPNGMRLTDLADRVGMTKQALGEFATALEQDGLMESLRDPGDRRVRLLRVTAAGRRAVLAGDRVIGEVEASWRARIGDHTWDQLRGNLIDVIRGRDLGPR